MTHFAKPRIAVCWLVALVLLALGGCMAQDEELNRAYGQRRGLDARDSVNGTAVFAEMFERAGHRVVTKQKLTPSTRDADAIVWFPNDFAPPSPEAIAWLEDWLQEEDGRVLIYVGRDFDAAIPYWEKALPKAKQRTAPVRQEMRLRAQADKTAFGNQRTQNTSPRECAWYAYDPGHPRRQVTTLEGPWSQGIDATKAEIELYGKRSEGSFGYADRNVLLSSDGDVLVDRIEFEVAEYYYDSYDDEWYVDESAPVGSSEAILVTNGSFLLNEPLINHEHRKLAGKLINRCAGQDTVVFLESGPDGVPILDRDPPPEVPSSLAIFKVWPLNIILVHLAVVGVVFCFARWPIFGRPRKAKQRRITDFGHHVAALGAMLEQTQDRGYARAQLAAYRHADHADAAAGKQGQEPRQLGRDVSSGGGPPALPSQ